MSPLLRSAEWLLQLRRCEQHEAMNVPYTSVSRDFLDLNLLTCKQYKSHVACKYCIISTQSFGGVQRISRMILMVKLSTVLGCVDHQIISDLHKIESRYTVGLLFVRIARYRIGFFVNESKSPSWRLSGNRGYLLASDAEEKTPLYCDCRPTGRRLLRHLVN